ncbi:MAG: tyrosine-type recombinase/integrase [Gammaproteobacteria bacterium]
MARRESRFTKEKSLTPEMKALPVLAGETSVYANAVDTYLAGKSDATKRMVRSHMNKVAILFDYPDYLQCPWGSIRYEHVQTLIGVLQQQKYAHTTINAILAAIRGTVRAAMGMRLMTADDYQRIMLVKMVSGTRLQTGRMMSQGEIKALVDACLNDYLTPNNIGGKTDSIRSPAAYRDLAIFGLMYIGGLRRSEVADLNVEDIDLELKETRIIGKGNKERMLFLDDGTVTAVRQWLSIRGDFDGALFYRVLKNGKIQAGRLSDQAIYNIVKKRQAEAGIAEISPHDFRKTFISTILEETGDLRMAQALAGHSDPKTTANYDRRKQEDMRKAAGSLHFPLTMTDGK